LRTASALATLVALAPVAAAQDRNANASSFKASVALIRPTVQPPAPGDVSTDVAPPTFSARSNPTTASSRTATPSTIPRRL
jgi:hypothetical protein